LYEAVNRILQVILNLAKAMRAPILIKQYKNEIQKLEQLLKCTKHSQKRRKHEKYLKSLHKRLNELRRVSEKTNDSFVSMTRRGKEWIDVWNVNMNFGYMNAFTLNVEC
jgi:ribosomal protein S10